MIPGIAWFFIISAGILIVISLILRANEITDFIIERVENRMSRQDQTEEEETRQRPTAAKRDEEYISDDEYGFRTGGAVSSNIENYYHGGDLELPVNGATGYASVNISLMSGNETLASLKAGTAFLIIKEEREWWYISVDTDGGKKEGWVQHIYCMINLPDVIPSIIYDNTNAYNSAFMSSEEFIPGITGERLYSYSDKFNGKVFNERLSREEYIMPALYSTAKRISRAQRNALENGDTLILYEAFRPYSAQMAVVNGLSAFANANSHIRKNVSTATWGMSWFIATGVSNHQKGYAIDVSLARIITITEEETGGYKYRRITQAEYYAMPTDIHELSVWSISQTRPINPDLTDSWRGAELSPGMLNSPEAQRLREYCTDAGFTPLASEWWHFNDLQTRFSTGNRGGGNFEIKEIFSVPPG
jgi:D-alanyl-D-alanine dipeptidase